MTAEKICMFRLKARDEAEVSGVQEGSYRSIWGGGWVCPEGYGELLKCFKQKTVKDGIYDLTNHSSNSVEDRLK